MEGKKVTEEDIRVSVGKDSTDRLRAEILDAQNVLDKAQVGSLSRDRLIEYVCQLRSLADQTERVQNVTGGFNPKIVKWDGGKVGAAEGGAKPEVGTLGATDMASVLIKMLQNMEDQAKRQIEEEVKREEKRGEEIKKQKEERDAEIKRQEKREEDWRQEKIDERKRREQREDDFQKEHFEAMKSQEEQLRLLAEQK